MFFIGNVSHCCLETYENCAMPSYLALYLFKVIKNHKYLWTAFFFLFFPPSGFNCFLRFLLFRFSLCPPSVIQEIETRRELSFLFLLWQQRSRSDTEFVAGKIFLPCYYTSSRGVGGTRKKDNLRFQDVIF